MQVVIGGFARHAPILARLLNEHAAGVKATYYPTTHCALIRAAARAAFADAVIFFGGPRPQELLQAICNVRARPAILVWAGSDVLEIAQRPRELEALRLSGVAHWATAQNLVAELGDLGIHARYVNVVATCVPDTPARMPARFSVLTYLPRPRRDFYGQQAVWEAAHELADVRFTAVGAGAPETAAPPNVEYVGDVTDMHERIDSSCVVFRMTRHDGLPRGIVDALARGRHAIWTYELPGVIRASSHQQAIEALHRLRDAHGKNELGWNRAGIEYVAAYHDPSDVAKGIIEALGQELERATSHRKSPSGTAAYRLAISGDEMLSARVAANCAKYCPRVSPVVLGAHSRSELALSILTLLRSNAWYTIGDPRQPRAFELAARLSRKARIIHWIGRDVAVLRQNGRLIGTLKSGRYRHVAQTEGLASDLRALGLRVQVLPVAAALAPRDVRPLPAQFTIFLYLSCDRPLISDRRQFERLMCALSGQPVHYIIVGGGSIDVPAGISAESIPWQPDLGPIYDKATVVVRFTQPDSVSMMVIEALLHGRHVICSEDLPYVIRANGSGDLEKAVRVLLARHLLGKLTPRTDAARAMRAQYAPQRCLDSLIAGVCV